MQIKPHKHHIRLVKKRRKQAKIKLLREHYQAAKSSAEKQAIVEKALKVNAFLTKETFLAEIKEKV